MLDFLRENAIFFMPCVFILGYTAGQFFIMRDLDIAVRNGSLQDWLKKMGI
jgi:hypothetical protein